MRSSATATRSCTRYAKRRLHRIDTLARIVADDVDVALRTHAEMWQILQRLDMTSPYAPACVRIRESLQIVLDALQPKECE